MRDQVFISYRRSDFGATAEALNEVLSGWFGDDAVFWDRTSIDGGDDFDRRIGAALGRAQVVVAAIGPTWASAADKHGNRRLFNDNDYVRHELRTALASDGVIVIPLLLNGTPMPCRSDLPADLQLLRRRQARRATVGHLRRDLKNLRDDILGAGVRPRPGGGAEALTSLVKSLKPPGVLAPVDEWDPYSLGTTPSHYGMVDTYGQNDPYVERTNEDFDRRLREALQPGRFVLIEGPSKVGKSRSAFEAVKAEWSDALLVRPTDAQRLAAILRADWPDLADRRWVLWLDDLDRYFGGSEPFADNLEALLSRTTAMVAIATIRPEPANRWRRATAKDRTELRSVTMASSADAHAVLRLPALGHFTLQSTARSDAEQRASQHAYPDAHLDAAGLSESLSGAIELSNAYRTLGAESFPVARLLVEIAVDWERIGMPGPIPESDLLEFARSALSARFPERDDANAALVPAIDTVILRRDDAGNNALLTTTLTDSGRAFSSFPFLVAVDDGQGGNGRGISDHTWNCCLAAADASTAFDIGVIACVREAFEKADSAFTKCVALLDRDDPEPAFREHTATALVNKGFTLGQMGRRDDALAAYDEVIDRYSNDPEPALRKHTATALVNKGFTLGQMGRPDDELAAYDEAIDRYSNDPEHALRKHTATALINKGITLGQMGRPDDALAAYDDVIDRYSNDPEPALRKQTATALVNKGFRLGQMGRPDDELAAYDEAIDRYSNDPEHALRERTATALLGKATTLGRIGRPDDELAAYDEIINLYNGDEGGEIPRILEAAGEIFTALTGQVESDE